MSGIYTSYDSLYFILGGCSEFRFDDSPVSRSAYIAELEKIGIIVKARNCLVFQVSSCKGYLVYNSEKDHYNLHVGVLHSF